ncbi:ABC transporter substrate-binding protein, partial [Candidatus Omnitrophota bacterium]
MKKIVFLILFLLFALECRAEPHRIISLAPNATEILFALGLEQSIVAVDEYSNYPEKVRQIERIGAFNNPNIERMILLRPDYILVNADMDKELSDYLERLGS